MITQRIRLDKYDWEVTVHYKVTRIHADAVLRDLEDIGCDGRFLRESGRMLRSSDLDTGICCSCGRRSVVVIHDTSSPCQFLNSLMHETTHLVRHMAECYGMKPGGEEEAYLAGHIGQMMYPVAKRFMCDRHEH